MALYHSFSENGTRTTFNQLVALLSEDPAETGRKFFPCSMCTYLTSYRNSASSVRAVCIAVHGYADVIRTARRNFVFSPAFVAAAVAAFSACKADKCISELADVMSRECHEYDIRTFIDDECVECIPTFASNDDDQLTQSHKGRNWAKDYRDAERFHARRARGPVSKRTQRRETRNRTRDAPLC